MNITSSQKGTTQVFTVTGRLDTDTAPEFEINCQEGIPAEAQTLILDFSKLEYLSSAGLRTILATGKKLQGEGKKMVLVVPDGLIRQIIEASGFHKLFVVCADMEEAGKHATGTFRIFMRKEWQVEVMMVVGRVDAERAPVLEEAGRKILIAPYQKLIMDMSKVDYLSSAGLCALLNLGKVADANKSRMFICNPGPSVRQIFKLSGFDKILKIRDSVNDAVTE